MQLKGNRVASYARYSSDRQNELSNADQLRRHRTFASTHGKKVDDVLTFHDDAVSGASTARPGFEALMQKVQRREIDVLLVEDISRLSRDNADALNLYKTFAYYGVQLVSIADGIDSARKGAKLAYSVKALMSDLYLEDLRDKTLRGMEGRALAGHATGGRVLGYRTVPQLGPDGRTPAGVAIEIDPETASVVRRIFSAYLSGLSFGGIAKALNRDGVPSPRDKTRHALKGGWSMGTIRAILHNERYIGVVTFNERRWVKIPGTNKRRPEKRDASEVIRTVRDDLRIIDRETWDATQERLRETKVKFTRKADGQPKGRAHGAVTLHPFSGMLVCGACEGAMTIMGGYSDRRYYACTNSRRGRCDNKKSVRADVVRRCILGAMRTRLATPEGIAHARKLIVEALAEVLRNREAEIKERRGRLARTEARIANLVEVLASGERSPAITNALHDMESQADAERRAIGELDRLAAYPVRLPTPAEVMQRVFDLEARLEEDPIAGREQLRHYFADSKIRLEVQADGYYVAKAELLPVVLLTTETQNPGSGVTGAGTYTLRVAGAGFEPTTFGL